MDTLSVWRGTAAPTGYGMLSGDVTCDVLIIGGGITGVTLSGYAQIPLYQRVNGTQLVTGPQWYFGASYRLLR